MFPDELIEYLLETYPEECKSLGFDEESLSNFTLEQLESTCDICRQEKKILLLEKRIVKLENIVEGERNEKRNEQIR